MSTTSNIYLLLGATSGIGMELARRLAAGGARLFLVARDPDKLAAFAQTLPGEVATAVADATESPQVDAAVNAAVEQFGKIDGAVNLVGSILLKPAHLTSDQEWRQTLALNLDSAFYLLRAAAKTMMTSGGGSVVLVSSVAARLGLTNHEAIAAAKAGVSGLVLAAAASYAARGIRVNAVAPGLVRTPLTARLTQNEATLKASVAMHPLGRIGEPADIASAIEWLLNPAQGWVTGQVLSVDGGMGAVRPR
jgi:NAD(P)-dependent dehydrogenase (short-subunit alcohol dehydrogenase family)